MLTQPGERRYEVIRRWIAQGASLDLSAPRVVSIELHPANPIVPREQMSRPEDIAALIESVLRLPNTASVAELLVNWRHEDTL